MDYNEEIKKLLKNLKTKGHDRRLIEKKLGYSENGIDQSLARPAGPDREKLYRQVLLYDELVSLKDSSYGSDSELTAMLKDAISANKVHADANKDNAEANKKHADSINQLVGLLAVKINSGGSGLISPGVDQKDKGTRKDVDYVPLDKKASQKSDRMKRKQRDTLKS